MLYLFKRSIPLLCMLMSLIGSAQNFGFFGGPTLYTFQSDVYTIDFQTGFNLGFNYNIPVKDKFFLTPSILFNTKGGYHNSSNAEWNLRIHSFDLPVYLNSIMKLGKKMQMIVGLGPYLGVAIAGRATGFTIDDSGTLYQLDGKVKWNQDAGVDSVKRFDYGLSANLGFKYNSVHVRLAYDYGLRAFDPLKSSYHRVLRVYFGF